jgi:tricorn protease-like protein
MDGKQMEILKKHGFVSERKPTNFKDYDPNAVNTDGSKGNIMPSGNIVFENVPLDQAVLRADAQAKK